jgi:flagellar protein FliL
MAETPTPVSSENQAPKKSRKTLFIIILAVLLIGGGGGGIFFYQRSVTAKSEKNKSDKRQKKKEEVEKSTEDEDESPEKGDASNKKTNKLIELSLPEDADVKNIVELQPFIVNLADKDDPRYLRTTISLGLSGEGGEAKPDPIFTTRVRNAMLAVLTTKTSEELLSVEGKTLLRKELLRAAQAASEEPKVEAIYITDFIVQL